MLNNSIAIAIHKIVSSTSNILSIIVYSYSHVAISANTNIHATLTVNNIIAPAIAVAMMFANFLVIPLSFGQ